MYLRHIAVEYGWSRMKENGCLGANTQPLPPNRDVCALPSGQTQYEKQGPSEKTAQGRQVTLTVAESPGPVTPRSLQGCCS